ncbi:Hypothetical predicted protein [Cloeon dipterum]|uniref:Uncharacterized protein n=1 Tax=Cloeon dipterum TaxID=197152 RepID=A0A8S1DS13_9INSE|nr:Hypothetical predicted protein [Cloeon dipterum]
MNSFVEFVILLITFAVIIVICTGIFHLWSCFRVWRKDQRPPGPYHLKNIIAHSPPPVQQTRHIFQEDLDEISIDGSSF